MAFINFLKKYQDLVLGFFAVIFLAVIIWLFLWGTRSVVVEVNKAVSLVRADKDAAQFNLDGARKILQARGLLQ